MIREYLLSLIYNAKILDLFLICAIYIISYLILFTFGSKISRSIFISKYIKYKIIRTSIIMGLFGIFFKPVLSELAFGIINSILILIVLVYYFDPKDFKSFLRHLGRAGWSFIILNLIIGLSVTIICQPLMLVIPISLYSSTIGIICGTIIEFLPILLLLIFGRKKVNKIGKY
jgi:hypothetical protein